MDNVPGNNMEEQFWQTSHFHVPLYDHMDLFLCTYDQLK